MSGSTQCPHPEVHWHLNEQRFGDTNLRYLEVTGRCKTCDASIAFRGAPLGLSPEHVTMALGGAEARLPFIFDGEELKGAPVGFSVRRTA